MKELNRIRLYILIILLYFIGFSYYIFFIAPYQIILQINIDYSVKNKYNNEVFKQEHYEEFDI